MNIFPFGNWATTSPNSGTNITPFGHLAAIGAVTNPGGTFANDASNSGDDDWNNLTAPETEGGSESSATGALVGANTEYLKGTNFGFSLPSGAVVDGIRVRVKRREGATSNGVLKDEEVKIVKGGTLGSTNKASTNAWAEYGDGPAFEEYGGPSDLWGETWTDSDINASTFGFVISGVKDSGATAASQWLIDYADITVYYTESSGVSITPNDTSHTHTVDSPTLTQTHVISPNETNHSHTVDSPTITQVHVITPNATEHTHTAESPTFTETYALTVQSTEHSHVADSPALTQTHEISPNATEHIHTVDSPTVDEIGTVYPNNTEHTHQADSPALTQTHVIVVADTSHSHTADSPALTQVHVISPNDTEHGHEADSPSVSLVGASVYQAFIPAAAVYVPGVTQATIYIAGPMKATVYYPGSQ